jgi:sugar phosphate isomerase/epimerase
MKIDVSRRELMGGSLAAFASLGVSSAAPRAEDETSFKLGVASYSFRKLSRAEAIKAMEALNCKYINIKEFHAPLKSTTAELEQARKDFENAGIKIIGVGNISLRKDEGEIRHAFEYAKTLGAPVMVMAPSHENLPKIEKYVKEYNIMAAIHNHGPEDKGFFPGPQDVLKAVKGMDERVGLCVDLGHTARTGTNPLEGVKMAGKRLHDIHSKDLADMMNKDSQVAVGDGVLPIPQIFQYLMKSGYKGGVMLEYEINADNPLPGMQKSFAYMRGVLAGLKA